MIHATITGSSISQTSNRTTAILVGVLFLTSTATFVVGNSLITSHFSGLGPGSSLVTGVLLEVYTGLAVAGIGLAMLPLLTRHSPRLARAYLALRVLECLAIVATGAYMLATRQQLQHYDLFVYLFTAIGGMIFSYLLFASGLVPRLLAGLGMVGYVALLAGIPVALLGLASLKAGPGMVFFAPGGLFELILPLWLFVRGFKSLVD